VAVEDTSADSTGNNALLHALTSQLGSGDGKFLCAFSGGLDSTVLLHALSKQPHVEIRAIHVHHGLHPEADTWAAHCEEFCRHLNIELILVRVEVSKNGEGIEAAARNERYRAMAEHIRGDEILLTAHHLEDQAETILLRLLRGSGSQGLAAMRAESTAWGFRQLRPLLSCSRDDLRAYAINEKLAWIEDPSNEKTDFDRNYLRHEILPLLQKRWPQVSRNLSRSAALMAEEHECLREQATRFLAHIAGVDPRCLSVSALMKHNKAWRAQILRTWVESLAAPPLPASILCEIEQCLLVAKPDTSAQVRWADTQINRWRDGLYLSDSPVETSGGWQIDWDGKAVFEMPDARQWGFVHAGDAMALSLAVKAAFEGELRVSLRTGGEKILLEHRGHRSSVKNRLQELGVPPFVRKTLPVLSTRNGECLAVGDVLLSARFKAFCTARAARFSRIV